MLKKYLPLILACLLCACASKSEDAAVRADINEGYNEFNTTVKDGMQDVEAAFEGGYSTSGPLSPEERDHVRQMAIYCNTSQDNIRALRQKGLAWSAIAQKYGFYNTRSYRQNCRYWKN